MNEVIQVLTHDIFTWIIPEMILVAAACLMFVGGTFRPGRDLWGWAALLSLALASVALWFAPGISSVSLTALYTGPVTWDRLAIFFKIISLGGGAILILTSWNEVPERAAAEYQACVLIIVAGLSLTGSANDLVTLFLALELISIPTYVLLYLPKQDNAALEAAMKYFLLSIFASALMLFGFSYLYGLAGTTNLPAIAEALTRNEPTVSEATVRIPGVAMAALVLIVAGLGFKLAAVPFHFYAPDVYQGTSNSLAALLAFIPKVAAIAALIRIFNLVPLTHGGPQGLTLLEGSLRSGFLMGLQVGTLFWILAAVSMTLGNLLALLQNDLRRLLAYSSVAHAGYMLIGLASAPHLRNVGIPGGVEAVLFYLIAYGAMTIGAFAVIGYLDTPERPVKTVDDLGGLIRTNPGLALLMGLFLFSLIGIPPTAGFFGKFFLLQGALGIPSTQTGSGVDTASLFKILALVTVLNAAVGAWYYLRIAAVIFLRNPLKPEHRKALWPNLIGIGACALITLILAAYAWPDIQKTVYPVPVQQAKR
jgi:NADH-quinone oxidoreductase subunit N